MHLLCPLIEDDDDDDEDKDEVEMEKMRENNWIIDDDDDDDDDESFDWMRAVRSLPRRHVNLGPSERCGRRNPLNRISHFAMLRSNQQSVRIVAGSTVPKCRCSAASSVGGRRAARGSQSIRIEAK